MLYENFSFDKVIIIDDTEVERYISNRILKKYNFAKEIVEFARASEAIKFLEGNKDNLQHLNILILLDIHMPLMDGFEFLEETNELLEVFKENCNVIIYSSSFDDADHKRALDNRLIKTFIRKPLNEAKLREIKNCCTPFIIRNRA
jgi:CheY-like chemotaxis protein